MKKILLIAVVFTVGVMNVQAHTTETVTETVTKSCVMYGGNYYAKNGKIVSRSDWIKDCTDGNSETTTTTTTVTDDDSLETTDTTETVETTDDEVTDSSTTVVDSSDDEVSDDVSSDDEDEDIDEEDEDTVQTVAKKKSTKSSSETATVPNTSTSRTLSVLSGFSMILGGVYSVIRRKRFHNS